MQRVDSGMFIRDLVTESDQPPLLYLHGLGESGLCFERIVHHRALAQFHHIIPDLPGYGRSLWPEHPLDLDQLADLLADWMHIRQVPPCIVVGHSMGGVLGLLLAERHPARVHALIDVDGNKSIGDCTFSGQAASEPLATFISSGFDQLQASIYRDGTQKAAFRGYYASMRFCDPRAFHAHSLQLVSMSRQEDLARRLAALPMPKHYVAGSPDGACARSLELLRRAKVSVDLVEPSGHWPFLDQPDSFARAIAAWISSLREASTA